MGELSRKLSAVYSNDMGHDWQWYDDCQDAWCFNCLEMFRDNWETQCEEPTYE